MFAMTNEQLRKAILDTSKSLSESCATAEHRKALQNHLEELCDIERSRAAMLATPADSEEGK